jgi:hypothetical protein
MKNQDNSQITTKCLSLTTTIGITILCLFQSGCETVPDQYGQPKQVLSRQGAAVLNTLIATGVGTASGALMKNQPGYLNGLVSSLSGSVASQLVNSLATSPSQTPNYQIQRTSYIDYDRINNYQAQMAARQMRVTRTPYGTYGRQMSATAQNYPTYQTRNYQNGSYANQNQGEVLYARLPNGQFVQVDP